MLLALDVGNTNITIGLYEGAARRGWWRLRTERERTADEYAVTLAGLLALEGRRLREVAAVVVANVVPPTRRPLEELCERRLGVTLDVVGENLTTPMAVRYSPPTDVGADRLVNAFAAARLHGAPAVIVDFGTATTFDAVAADGAYVGGSIAPGIGISLDALFRAAARLQRVDLVKPPQVIGRTTVESVQSGVLYGFAGQVDGVVRRFRAELGEASRVIATGGLAELIAPETESIDVVDPFLTLDGLSLLWRESHCRS
jgi:type III pantothenate kinase